MQKVAVTLPVYKNDKVPYIHLSLDSILNQTYKNIHLYVGVDGPVGEDLEKCLKEYEQNDKVTVCWFPENRGLAIVLNDLLDVCFKADYNIIARMDADDISMLERIEKQVAYLESHQDIDVVGGAIEEIDENSESRGKTITYPETHDGCYSFLLEEILMLILQLLLERDFLKRLDVNIVLNTDKTRIRCCGWMA